MKKITISEFKKKSLRYLQTLQPEGLLITKHGTPIALITPVRGDSKTPPNDLIGCLKDKIKISGNILSTGLKWDPLLALRGSGKKLWADEHADEYVRRLRKE